MVVLGAWPMRCERHCRFGGPAPDGECTQEPGCYNGFGFGHEICGSAAGGCVIREQLAVLSSHRHQLLED
jgi:hypothetical protein